MLRAGGSAIDAAIATGLALSVVEPSASGIGGGGFMLIRLSDGHAELIDFREKAPAAASPELFYQNGKLNTDWVRHGGRSVAVPGVVAGYQLALKRHGKLAWAGLFDGAIRCASEGFEVGE